MASVRQVPSQITVASFNVHAGVDGWGRAFDVVPVCGRLDADVLVLQEVWTPDTGTAMAEQVATELGYRATVAPMGPAWLFPAPPRAGDRWGPVIGTRRTMGMRLIPPRRRADIDADEPSSRRLGTIGVALLLRPPFADVPSQVIELGSLGGDMMRRVALQVRLPLDGTSLVVTATHMSHLRHGSPRQIRLLSGRLPPRGEAAVLMGDMNLWGPPLAALLPGWSLAVRGRTWPAWRPLFQIDHVLVTSPVRVVESEVVGSSGSDHRPVRAVLALP
jgi:endonuclease/exonuclease/phosphatase family metal-dependent hydrolase